MGKEGEEGIECAECECERAEVVCRTETLAYCNSCSHKIHSKKARSHHQILPIATCSHCLIRSVALQCFQCSKKHFVLCTQCSKSIHSAPSARAHKITILAFLSNIVKSENQLPTHVKEKEKSQGSHSANKERKRKAGSSISDLGNEYTPAKKAKFNVSQRRGNIYSDPKVKYPPEEMLEKQQVPQASSLPRRNIPRAASRRGFGPVEIHDISSDSEANEDSDSCYSDFERESGIRRIKRGNFSVEAFVVNAEEEGDVAEGTSAGKEESEVVGVKVRIRKMLELGLHPDTPDIEAQQALKNAHRLLTKYNLQQAEVMNGALKDSEALAGGMRMVEVIFYGIKQNADCSGFAFAATFNRITIMSANYIPSKTIAGKENKEPSTQSSYTRIARNNYKLGIVAGLRDAVKRSSSEDGDGRKGNGTKRIENKQEAAMQALVLHSKEVGEAYIKEKGLKFESFQIRKRESKWSLEAFAHGKMDSKQLDINQKALPTNHREES